MIKLNNNYILAFVVILLCAVCVNSVYSPLRFDRMRTEREQAVKERLIKIRSAQERYRKAHGSYSADLQWLVDGGLMADSLQYIPFADGKKFDIATTVVTGKSGRTLPLMECGAKYNDYLYGLDENTVSVLIEDANKAGRYPGLKIGDINTPNDNAGNWE